MPKREIKIITDKEFKLHQLVKYVSTSSGYFLATILANHRLDVYIYFLQESIKRRIEQYETALGYLLEQADLSIEIAHEESKSQNEHLNSSPGHTITEEQEEELSEFEQSNSASYISDSHEFSQPEKANSSS